MCTDLVPRVLAREGHALELIDRKGVEGPLDKGDIREPLGALREGLDVDEDAPVCMCWPDEYKPPVQRAGRLPIHPCQSPHPSTHLRTPRA